MGALNDLLPMLIAAEEAAGGHHESHFAWFELISTFVNFIVFAAIIGYAVRKPLAEFLVARREGMAAQLREAKRKQEEADRRLAEYADKLEHLEDEVARIVRSFEAQGEADRERLKEDADKAIDRLVRETDFTIRQETLKAQKAIRETAVASTLELAETLVKDRITDADRRRLADEYIHHVEQTPLAS